MNRRNLETLLLTLESTPALRRPGARGLAPRRRSAQGPRRRLLFLEHVWHLADLEREGYGVRIRRILSEDEPSLSDFEGDRIARERCYQSAISAEGLALFARRAQRNIAKLRRFARPTGSAAAAQDGVGAVTLEDIPRMMADHDRAHTDEIAALLAPSTEGRPFEPRAAPPVRARRPLAG